MDQKNANQLVEKIIAGDAAAERELFESYKDEVEFLVKLKIGNSNSYWQDLCQDIFIAFFQRIRDQQFDCRKGTLGAFLQSTIKFKIQDFRKSPANARRHQYDDISGIDLENPQTPEIALEDAEEKQALREAIMHLKEPYREVLYLWLYRQFKVNEISESLGISEQKVSNLKSYALTLLRKFMKKS